MRLVPGRALAPRACVVGTRAVVAANLEPAMAPPGLAGALEGDSDDIGAVGDPGPLVWVPWGEVALGEGADALQVARAQAARAQRVAVVPVERLLLAMIVMDLRRGQVLLAVTELAGLPLERSTLRALDF